MSDTVNPATDENTGNPPADNPPADNQGSSNQGSSSDSLQGLSNASQAGPSAVQGCNQKKHWVGIHLRYEDDRTDVPAADCLHLSGDTVNGGPLAAGQLETHELDAGSYQATFPDIDASEWELES
jgi:hypothetical protein